MKYPTVLDKSKLDMNQIAKELLDANRFGERLNTVTKIKQWLSSQRHDIYIFDRYEKGFEDWDERDYCNNMTENHFEPYAITTKNYIVMHDYS